MTNNMSLIFDEWGVRYIFVSAAYSIPSYALFNMKGYLVAAVYVMTDGVRGKLVTSYRWQLNFDFYKDRTSGEEPTLIAAQQAAESALTHFGYSKLDDKLRVML